MTTRDQNDEWQIGITAHPDHTKEQITEMAKAIGIGIRGWEQEIDDGDTRIHIANATISDEIHDAMQRDGGWEGTAGDDEHGISIDIDPGDAWADEEGGDDDRPICPRCGASWADEPTCGKSIHDAMPRRRK